MKKLFFFIILTFAIHLFSNDSEDKIFIIEDATFHSNDISELLQFYRYNPIEVNFCTPTKLLELPWLDKEIIEKLVKYRKQKMISNRKDLIEIGFDKITIKEISPYITYTKQMTKHLFSRTYYSFQEKHKDEISPYKSYQKIQYRFSNITLGGQIQKDISEINYFDYYSYYLWLHDYKYVKNLIVGKYRLAFGQGILFSPALGAKKTSATTTVPLKNYLSIKPYTSTFEMWDLEGAVVHLQLENYFFVPFYSNTKLDANFADGEISSFDLTGIHQDLEEKDNLRDELIGVSSGYKNDEITFGFVFYNEKFKQLTEQKLEFDYKNNVSFFGNGSINNFRIFGEISGNDKKIPRDLIVGFRFTENKFKQLLLYRNYCRENFFYHGNPFSATSNAKNEKGIYYGITYTPNSNLKINSYFDIWRHEYPKYFEDMPTSGNDQLLQCEYKFSDYSIRLLYKRKSKDVYKSFENQGNITNFERNTIRVDFFQPIVNHLLLKNRAELSFEEYDEFSNYQKGILIAQQFIYKAKELEFVIANTFYKSEILLYLYEYSVDGIMRNSILSDDDIFSYFLVKYNVNNLVEIQTKISYKWVEEDSAEFWLQLIQEF